MERQSIGAIPVMLVEEGELFRRGLRTLIEGAGLAVVGEYSSAATVLNDATELEPRTVVLCSLTQPGWQELVRRLLLRSPDCPILGVVDEVSEGVAIEALSNGVLGCVDRAVAPERWVDAIRELHAGELSPVRTMLQHRGVARHALVLLSQAREPSRRSPLAPVLGDRERLALANVSEGVPLDMIVERMGVSEQGLNEVLESACRKLVARHRLSWILDRVR